MSLRLGASKTGVIWLDDVSVVPSRGGDQRQHHRQLAATAAAGTGEAAGCDVFVAAGSGSIAQAQHEIQALLGSSDAASGGDLLVCLGGGVHSVGAGGVTMTGADAPVGGGRRVVWRGSGSAAAPTIVSGGVQVTGWKAAVPGTADGLYAAPVPTAARHLQAVRQLWVSGQRANRTSIVTPGCLMSPPAGAPPPPGCRLNQTSVCAFDIRRKSKLLPGPAVAGLHGGLSDLSRIRGWSQLGQVCGFRSDREWRLYRLGHRQQELPDGTGLHCGQSAAQVVDGKERPQHRGEPATAAAATHSLMRLCPRSLCGLASCATGPNRAALWSPWLGTKSRCRHVALCS